MLRDQSLSDNKRVFLGKTLFGSEDKTYNRIEPLAEATYSGWKLITDRIGEFPSEGKVFTFDHQYAKKEDQYVLFTTIENERDGTDRKLVDEICEPYEIIANFSQLPKSEQRLTALKIGLERGAQSLDRIILPIDDKRCIFPKFYYSDELRRWIISRQETLADINVFCYSKTDIGADVSFNGRYFALPNQHPNIFVNLINWDTDAECLGAALNFIRRTEDIQAGGDLFGLSKQTIRRLQQIYSQSGMLEKGDSRLAALFDRINDILPNLIASNEYVNKFAEQITSNKVIRNRFYEIIEKLKLEELEEFRNSERKKIYTNIRSEIPDLVQKKENLQNEISILELEINKKNQEYKTIQDELSSKINEINSFTNTEKALNDVRTEKVLPISANTNNNSIDEPSLNGENTDKNIIIEHIHQIIDKSTKISVDSIPDNLRRLAHNTSLNLNKLQQLDIALRSGELLTISGGGAQHLIETYAVSVFAGETLHVELNPNLIGVDDLWRDTSDNSETAFSKLWKTAINFPNNTYFVLFHGCESLLNPYLLTGVRRVFRREKPANLLCALLKKNNQEAERMIIDDTEIKLTVDLTTKMVNSIIIDRGLVNHPRTSLFYEINDMLQQDNLITLLGATINKSWLYSEHVHQFLNIARASLPWKLKDEEVLVIADLLLTQP